MIKVNFISLGCPKNQVDSEYMMGMLFADANFKETGKISEAEVIVINTCGFIEDAKEESIDTILEAARYKDEGKCRSLVVTGCLSQRYKDELIDQMPEIDAILGTGNFDQIATTIIESLNGKKIKEITDPTFDYKAGLPRKLTNKHYSYVKIAEGCNNNCTYCSIPGIRGPLTSRKIENIYQEVQELGKNGVKEIILVAQDTTQYGIDLYGKPSLVKLLKKLLSIETIKWIRIMYSYPEHISDELIELMMKENKICNYLDLPIQHSSNRIRNLMHRSGKRDDLIKLINNLKNKIPDITVRTSLIVGFPGETKEDFDDLVSFVKTVGFDRLGVFKYSKEENTAAAEMPNQISDEVKDKRYNKIMKIQQSISARHNHNLVGKIFEVIVDECYNEYALGRTKFDAPEIDNEVYIKNSNLKTGDIIKCRIKDSSEYDLIGEKINESNEDEDYESS